MAGDHPSNSKKKTSKKWKTNRSAVHKLQAKRVVVVVVYLKRHLLICFKFIDT